jgi:hypothetical protein
MEGNRGDEFIELNLRVLRDFVVKNLKEMKFLPSLSSPLSL